MQLLQCLVCLEGGYSFAQLKRVHPKKCNKSGLKVESLIQPEFRKYWEFFKFEFKLLFFLKHFEHVWASRL